MHFRHKTYLNVLNDAFEVNKNSLRFCIRRISFHPRVRQYLGSSRRGSFDLSPHPRQIRMTGDADVTSFVVTMIIERRLLGHAPQVQYIDIQMLCGSYRVPEVFCVVDAELD